MKTLLLIRHAKSSWGDLSQKDFDRSLNDRGKKDTSEMAARLHKEKDVKLDTIISSPARRALSTAKFFADEFNIKKKNIIEVAKLYEASIEDFYNVMINIVDDFSTVALFSHNPSITAFSNILTNVRIDNMPTCAVFALHIKTHLWKDFKTAEKEFWFFDYPKNIMQF
ncbi:MAG: histidine phosphatase family protein [Parafilimonas sp.]